MRFMLSSPSYTPYYYAIFAYIVHTHLVSSTTIIITKNVSAILNFFLCLMKCLYRKKAACAVMTETVLRSFSCVCVAKTFCSRFKSSRVFLSIREGEWHETNSNMIKSGLVSSVNVMSIHRLKITSDPC